MAAGHDGTILYSDDGADWRIATQRLDDALAGAAYGRGRFVIAGKGGLVLVSETGERWVRRSLDGIHAVTGVTASPAGFLIGSRQGRLFRSGDAEAWEEIDLGTGFDVTALDGVYAGLADGTMLEIFMPPAIPVTPDGSLLVHLGEQGGDLRLEVPGISGAGPFVYQWQKDGIDLPGETGPALDLTDLQPRDAGSYRLRVANAAGASLGPPIAVALPMDYATWLMERSPLAVDDLEDPGKISPLAEPLGDGITNLQRYGFGPGPDPGGLARPRVGRETVPGYGFTEQWLTLTIPQPSGAADLGFLVETADSPEGEWTLLEEWETVAVEAWGERLWTTIRIQHGDGWPAGQFFRVRLLLTD